MVSGHAEQPQAFWTMEAADRSLFPESSLLSPRKYKELRVGIFAYYNDYLGTFHHQNCDVSHFTYLAITHLRCQLQDSQETVVLVEFCQ